MKPLCSSRRFLHIFRLSPACVFFFALAADGPSFSLGDVTSCDFILPPLSVQTSVLDTVSYPPLPLTSTGSRYSWACQAPNQIGSSDCRTINSTQTSTCKSSLFRVDARVSITASSMLLRAVNRCTRHGTASCLLNVEVVMSDALGSEFSIKSNALIDVSSLIHAHLTPVLPELWLKFDSHRCGCLQKLLFSWATKDGVGEESCEAPVAFVLSNEHSACAPAWAFSTQYPTCEKRDEYLQLSTPRSTPENACQPVNWPAVPPPKTALATSFDGNCR